MTADPNVDEIVLQDKDQVPNQELGPFWDSLRKKYDKFVNLSESVEAGCLALPHRTPHGWPPAARHKALNMNYLEIQHDLAGVPHKPQVRYFPTNDERAWAKKLRKDWGDYVVMFPLAGSSVHKTWPYIDNVIAALLLHSPTTHIVFTGDDYCQILEQGWEKEERVHRYSGKLSIRQTLSLTEVVDAMVGPETGVMNAAAQLDIPKIVMLSHSTPENLTRDWTNTYALWAEDVKCKGRGDNEAPACHQLHYGWEFCTKDIDPDCPQCKDKTCTTHTATAACQAAIKPERVTDILLPMIAQRKAA
jgi:ADP-heptose:LPS heptosyltransferase